MILLLLSFPQLPLLFVTRSLQTGLVRPHSHLRISVFTQHFVDVLDLTKTPLEYMMVRGRNDVNYGSYCWFSRPDLFFISTNSIHHHHYVLQDTYKDLSREDARKFLGRYGVSGDVQTQVMSQLSDGQKTRVVFAKIAKD